MSALPLVILIFLALLTWAIAIWASVGEEQEAPQPQEKKPEPSPSLHKRKAA